MTGRVHSLQSLGTVDGPGVRFVVFLQGCPLRCGCCHNPDTWDVSAGTEYSAEALAGKALNYREYFGRDGGVTVSGGEPLLQADFVREYFSLCKADGLHTCLDTSGCMLNESIKKLLSVTDRVLLDVKYTNENDYFTHVGCSLDAPLSFLQYLEEQKIPTTLRQVIIPSLNDTEENVLALKKIAAEHSCVDKVELLPFRKICQVKYDKMGISFPFSHIPEPSGNTIENLQVLLNQ